MRVDRGDPANRIRAGTRVYTVNDFLTKEMSLPWREAAPMLASLYAQQQREQERGQERTQPPEPPKARETPRGELWQAFREAQKAPPTRSAQWADQRAGEKTRREQIRQTFREARSAIEATHRQPASRKAALSLARMDKVIAESALRDAIKRERAGLKAAMSQPIDEQYREHLATRASGGDELALAELRRMVPTRRERDDDENTVRGTGPAPEQPKAPIHRAPAYAYQVASNGDLDGPFIVTIPITHRQSPRNSMTESGK